MFGKESGIRIYRRDSGQKLNTVITILENGWKAQEEALAARLERDGFSSGLCVDLRDAAWPESDGFSNGFCADLREAAPDRERTVVLTDDMARAKEAGAQGFVCVGCGGGSFFEGAGLVLETPDTLDVPCLEEHLCHMLGEAVKVAETTHLILKEISENEVDRLCEISRACEARFLQGPENENFFEKEKLRAYIRQVYRLYGYGLWSVLKKEDDGDGTVIGCCGLSDVTWKDGTARLELQYMVAEDERRRGYGWEMCRAALDLAKERAGAGKVWLRVHPENLPSLRLAAKLGFQREAMVLQNGELVLSYLCPPMPEEGEE